MTAQESRNQALAILTNETNSKLAQIMDSIKGAVEKGNLECYVYDSVISLPVREKLISLGYKIGKTEGDGGFRDGSITKIEW
jgi:hypothetical protein